GRGIFGDLPVRENLILGAYSAHARKSQTANLAKVYDLFPKLKERGSQIARTMSGGEQQMVAIGRAMMSDPKFLMLDEPSLGLSPLLCKELFANLRRVRETGIGVLMVEQNAKQSLAIADRGYLIENGSVVGENEAQLMLNDPAVQAAYLGGAASQHSPAKSPVTATATDTDPGSKTFISAGGLADNGIGQVTDDAIAAMVAKASQTGHAPPTPRQPTHSVEPVDETVPDNATSRPPEPQDTSGELQDLLRSMEESARNARIGAAPPHQSARSAEPYPGTDREEDLPKIPVYKKSKVEVFRRGPDGSMQRVKR
ncbi:MAG: ATP-binding cassette domain-containing protein, partial [Pseudomonadota bacterium]